MLISLNGMPHHPRGLSQSVPHIGRRSRVASVCVDQVATLFAVILEDARLDDRVDRTRLLAETAEDALGKIDVVTRGSARAVVSLFGFDGNRERRTHRLRTVCMRCSVPRRSGNAQGVSPLKRGDCGVFSSGNCTVILRAKKCRPVSLMPPTTRRAAWCGKTRRCGQSLQPHFRPPHPQWRLHPDATTKIQTMVIGMNTFQPSRMIWS